MRRSSFACAVALLSGHAFLSALPAVPPLALLAASAPAIVASLCRWPFIGLALAGFVSLGLEAHAVFRDRLDSHLVGRDVDVRVRIADFPDTGRVTRFLASPLDRHDLPARLRLSWYSEAVVPSFGECWRLTVRLRRPRGFANPGRFDYERWLFTGGIGATGYVRDGARDPGCVGAGRLTRLRRGLAGRLLDSLPDDRATAVLLAVTVGARQWLSDEQWQAFAATGTSHLMAISGMHVALASGGCYLLVRLLLGIAAYRGDQRLPATLAAVAFAAFYAAVSGLAVPARRAFLMLAIGGGAVLIRRPLAPWQLLGLTAVGVALATPLDVMTPGFQLSFAAVALLMLRSLYLGRPGAERDGGLAQARRLIADLPGLQIVLLLGMLPLTIAWFGRAAWLAPTVNLLVLPLFNLVALPTALAGCLLGGAAGDLLLLIAWRSVRLIDGFIAAAAAIPRAAFAVPALEGGTRLAAALVCLTALLPRAWPARHVLWVALLSVLLSASTRPPRGCVDIDVLDVGQGLAIVLRTRRRTLLYDAGPAFRSGSDTGALVVAPFLEHVGVRSVDLAILSHADLDHAGGMPTVADRVRVRALLAGEPDDLGLRGIAAPRLACAAGQIWTWDGIRFRVLHPPIAADETGNASSCVLEVAAGRHRALLPGDVEADVERRLLTQNILDASELVVMPHHGSKTSSHPAFVAVLDARLAIASAGYRNRWGMPDATVVERWQRSGARVLNTASDGAVGVRLCEDAGLRLRYRQRIDSRRFWHEP